MFIFWESFVNVCMYCFFNNLRKYLVNDYKINNYNKELYKLEEGLKVKFILIVWYIFI